MKNAITKTVSFFYKLIYRHACIESLITYTIGAESAGMFDNLKGLLPRRGMRRHLFVFIIIFILFGWSAQKVDANNLVISNVEIGSRSAANNTATIEFDVAWDNSWRNSVNHDAVWLTVRLDISSGTHTLCQLTDTSGSTVTGLDPSGTDDGSDSSLEIYVSSDSYGAWLRPASYQEMKSIDSDNVQLTVNYDSCISAGDTDTLDVDVYGIEMVYVPAGSFYAGDYDTSTGALHQGSSDSDPWLINAFVESEGINVTNAGSDGFRYVAGGCGGGDHCAEYSTGDAFEIPSNFPVGYDAFYAMKYEVTQEQWCDFVNDNTLDDTNLNVEDSNHKNADNTVLYRNTIYLNGNTCSTDAGANDARPYRPMSYLAWMDLAAFLDWSALRPMSELEYEKLARGPVYASPGEYAWGNTTITAADSFSAAEDGTHTVDTADANCAYSNQTYDDGDTGEGPVRAGIFATSTSDREESGAGYYGAMELSGNLWEWTVTIGNSVGITYRATHGDGAINNDKAGGTYDGYATNADWPGINSTSSYGVTHSTGAGLRGGSWYDGTTRLRVSDRYKAAQTIRYLNNTSGTGQSAFGGRGVRTYD